MTLTLWDGLRYLPSWKALEDEMSTAAAAMVQYSPSTNEDEVEAMEEEKKRQ